MSGIREASTSPPSKNRHIYGKVPSSISSTSSARVSAAPYHHQRYSVTAATPGKIMSTLLSSSSSPRDSGSPNSPASSPFSEGNLSSIESRSPKYCQSVMKLTSFPSHHTNKVTSTAHPGTVPLQDDKIVLIHGLVSRLFPVGAPQQRDQPKWLEPLVQGFNTFLRETSPENLKEQVQKLQEEISHTPEGLPRVSLLGASILQLSPVLFTHITPNPSAEYNVPQAISNRLIKGRLVPMAHILYGIVLKECKGVHVDEQHKEWGAEPYPLDIDTDIPPSEFVGMVRKVDIIRGITVHAKILSTRYPILASNMHRLQDQMWLLLFQDKLSAAAGMEIYDQYFKDFEHKLGVAEVLTLDQFPRKIIENVKARYKDVQSC